MGLFSAKTGYIGVDIGNSSVKIVELKQEGGKPKLVTYGYVDSPCDIVRDASEEKQIKVVEIIKDILKKSKITSKKAVAALPNFAVFSSIISLPKMNHKDLDQAVHWEAKKFVPMPIEEMVLDWKIVDENKGSFKDKEKNKTQEAESPILPPKENNIQEENNLIKTEEKNEKTFDAKYAVDQVKSRGNIRVLLTAAPKNLVERYLRIFRSAELELLSLETESFAIERALVGHDPTPIMIVDMGDISSDITVSEKGIPVLNRSVDVGGLNITQAIVNHLHVTTDRAEQFKRDIGFSLSSEQSIPEIIQSSLTPLINEVKYSLDLYLSQRESGDVEKIILTGGSSYLPKIDEFLSKLLNIKIYRGDPWARVIYPKELQPILQSIGARFAVSIGLALREID